MNDPLTIEIYSDVVCPWCYVGKRRLERALTQLATVRTSVTWRPFQLNPTMPAEGMDRIAYLEAKFGGLDTFRRLEEQVIAAGSLEGITFSFEKILRTPNTFLAHRLIWYSKQEGRQDQIVEALFRGYFEHGADIGSASALSYLAESAGLGAAEFSTVIESDEPVVADRTMTWNASGYGSHAETSLPAPTSTWYLAEGATHSGFSLFYLIQNPGSTATTVQVTYLLPAPAAPIVKSYTVAANSRFNIWVNQEGGPLASTDVSAVITAHPRPIPFKVIAEQMRLRGKNQTRLRQRLCALSSQLGGMVQTTNAGHYLQLPPE